MKVRCICIDGKNKPLEVPIQQWINEGTEYHITHIFIHPNQGSIQGVHLEEVKIKIVSNKYDTYRLTRFAIHLEDLDKFIELCKNCSDLNEVDIKKLIEESELEIIEN